MHPSTQLRRNTLADIRKRTQIATAEFYALTGIKAPVTACRFKVVPAGKAYHIKDSVTGKVKGFRFNHNAACTLARDLEQSQE